MKKLKIITGEHNPVLRAMSKPVKNFDAGLKKFVKQLRDAMEAAKGVGIAAPQVGENIRVFLAVLNVNTDHQVVVPMVNPEIVWHGEETNIAEEGCLSLPKQYGNVERFSTVEIEFSDLEGGRQKLKLQDYNARVVQHELDHLNGVLFLDRMKAMDEGKALVL